MSARYFVLLVLCVAVRVHAEDFTPVLRTNDLPHLRRALDALNMQVTDMGFEKDVAEPDDVLGYVRDLLAEPLKLPAMADRLYTELGCGEDGVWRFSYAALELEPPPSAAVTNVQAAFGDLDPALAAALSRFVGAATVSRAFLARAWPGLSGDDMAHAVATELVGLFRAEDQPSARADLAAFGIAPARVAQVIAEGQAIDPEPGARQYLGRVQATDLACVFEAVRVLQRACRALHSNAVHVVSWPTQALRRETPIGDILIGTPRDDVYEAAALLVLDPAGHDVYRGLTGSADGTRQRPVAAIVDLAGNDRYEGQGVLGPGSAVFGVAAIFDAAGDDTHYARYLGQASALFGGAWLEDDGGDDTYQAYVHSQAAASVGFGFLHDRSGNDTYGLGVRGQGYAGVAGFGLLLDDAGNDRYLAGGREPDFERHDDRFLSLAQGFATGMRPYAGGGFAALVDRAGNDVYVADVYGQGVSYWYSVGMLLDVAGNDTYSLHHYGQGSGIHLSCGLLVDGAGQDMYTGFVLAQGNAHDFGVGMLLDHHGDDTYTADHHSQGRALYNAMALLIDSEGRDAYFARRNDLCQGAGHDGHTREYGCLSLLLDLDGVDQYSCGATNNAARLRPLYGVVYDVSEAGP